MNLNSNQLATMLSRYNLRSFYDKNQRHCGREPFHAWWFCAVDICAILYDTTCYQQSKNHWKNAKRRLPRFDMLSGYVSTQMNLPCANGKLHPMDMLSTEDVLYLLQAIATGNNSKNRSRCKQWLALLCPKTVVQAIRERGSRGHFELVKQLGAMGRNLRMSQTWVSWVFEVGYGNLQTLSEAA